jgi:hypothetical protein
MSSHGGAGEIPGCPYTPAVSAATPSGRQAFSVVRGLVAACIVILLATGFVASAQGPSQQAIDSAFNRFGQSLAAVNRIEGGPRPTTVDGVSQFVDKLSPQVSRLRARYERWARLVTLAIAAGRFSPQDASLFKGAVKTLGPWISDQEEQVKFFRKCDNFAAEDAQQGLENCAVEATNKSARWTAHRNAVRALLKNFPRLVEQN